MGVTLVSFDGKERVSMSKEEYEYINPNMPRDPTFQRSDGTTVMMSDFTPAGLQAEFELIKSMLEDYRKARTTS